MFVADAITYGFTQICGERLPAAKIESGASSERLEDGVLDEIRRIRCRSSPSRKAAVCPPVERGKAPAHEAAERRAVAAMGLSKQAPRGRCRAASRGTSRHHIT
jgi:hypothetical protein